MNDAFDDKMREAAKVLGLPDLPADVYSDLRDPLADELVARGVWQSYEYDYIHERFRAVTCEGETIIVDRLGAEGIVTLFKTFGPLEANQ